MNSVRIRATLAFRVFALSLGALGVMPAAAADVDHGEQLARRWCASCHIVAEDQTRGSDNVPTFPAVARRPGFTAEKIARFLRDPHPKMPDMHLSRTEADDLAAYIGTLKK